LFATSWLTDEIWRRLDNAFSEIFVTCPSYYDAERRRR
jgi:hypothetical protein